MSDQEKSPSGYSTPSEIAEAEENLARSLEALDQKGEAGLEAEMERIHPAPPASGLERVPFLTSSYNLREPKTAVSSTPAPSGNRR